MDTKYDIGFIILQYGRPDLTFDCIKSIQKNVQDATKLIVVVDNCSPDDSADQIRNAFADSQEIVLLQTEQNMGFARGNNVGYEYAREKCNFICILNSDVMLTQKDFWEILKNSYKENQFALAGPYIYLPNMNQSELLMVGIGSLEFEKKELQRKKVYAKLTRMGLNPLREKLGELKRCIRKKDALKLKPDEKILHEQHENIVLNGCCLFYSPLYLARYEDAFDPRTFFYGEERLLYLRLYKDGLKSLYEPRLSVRHLKFGSTQGQKITRKKMCFQWQQTIIAQELLLQTLEEINWK